MARRKRSLLGGSGRPTTGLPVPPRSVGGSSSTDGPAAAPAESDPLVNPDPPVESAPPAAPAPSAESAPPVGSAPPAKPAPPVEPAPPAESAPPAEPAATVERTANAEPVVAAADLPPTEDPLIEDEAPIVGADLEVPPLDEGDDALRAPEQQLGLAHNPPPTPRDAQPAALSDVLVLFDEEPGGQPLPDPEVHVDDNPPGFDASAGLRGGTPEPARPRGPSPVPAPGLADDEWFRDEDGDLPTEEAHPSTIEDFEALYRAPMNVPEPPPIPGILDRFTPAPASKVTERPHGSGAEGLARPEFVPEPPSGVAAPGVPKPRGIWDETPLPTGGRAAGEDSEAIGTGGRSAGQPSGSPVWQDPIFLAIIIGAFLFAVVVLVGLAVIIGPAQTPPARPAEPATITPVAPVSVPAVQRPQADLAPALPDSTVDDLEGSEVDHTDPADPADPASDTVADPPAAPAPVAAPAPRPRPRPSPAADSPGKLIIRATRTTLVYVNGQPVGMSPAEVERPPGVYTIHITDKGKRIERRVDLDAGAIRTVDF